MEACVSSGHFGRDPDPYSLNRHQWPCARIFAQITCQRIRRKARMHWVRFALVVLGAGVASSLTDWFFAGDWIHRRYSYPEIWRNGAEGRAIALTSPLPFLTCGVFAYVTARLGLHS